jgi:hypothetical protein
MLRTGIVGLPNVGKSTLFNALTRSRKAEAANFPFCTIEPNIGVVNVPDSRLERLRELAGSEKVIPAAIEVVDIAGLVKGAGDAAAAVASPYLHAKFFGREHLGSIFAANRMAGVVGSGLGPLLIGAWADRSDGDYRAALRAISFAVLAATAAAQTVFWREEERRQRELVKPAGDVELVSLTSADGGGSSVGLGSS